MVVIIEEIFDKEKEEKRKCDRDSVSKDEEEEEEWVQVEKPAEEEIAMLQQQQQEARGNEDAETSELQQNRTYVSAEDDDDEGLSEEEKVARLMEAEASKAKGNECFKSGEYEEAIEAYTEALKTAPLSAKAQRAVYFSNRAACYLKIDDYENGIDDCSNAVDLNPDYVRARLRRALAFEHVEEYDRGLVDAKHILEIEPNNATAKQYVVRVEPIAEKKREEMKEEMISKLKDLGNSLLGNFGLSLDNFKAEKDPDTGSFSIKFAQ